MSAVCASPGYAASVEAAARARVFLAAGIDPGGCRPFYVLGADYEGRQRAEVSGDDDEPAAAAWRERWIVTQCGMRAAVDVLFPADPTHGGISVTLVRRYAP